MIIEKLIHRLTVVGLDVDQEDDGLTIVHENGATHIGIDEDWERAIRGYYRSRRINYEVKERIYWTPKEYERPIC